jgi:hypothetical protein
LLLLLGLALVVSFLMTFCPRRVLSFVASKRAWRWYLKHVLSIRQDRIESEASVFWVRLQGAVGLVFALLGLLAWIRGVS